MRWPNGTAIRHRVAKGESCESIGKLHGVPQFDLFNRNKSGGCCQLGDYNTSLSDILDLCAAPTLEQWRAEGHPRQPLSPAVMSYVGAMKTPAPESFPRSVNVVALGPVDDLPPPHGPQATAHQGVFRISPSFTGNCSAQVDPTRRARGWGVVGNRMREGADSSRVWLASMVPNYGLQHTGTIDNGNWAGGKLSPAEWGKNASESLGRIILRYRLDGIDINIEAGSPAITARNSEVAFGRYICALVGQLKADFGVGLVTSFTFYAGTFSHYEQVAKQCKDNVTMANWMTYSTNTKQDIADIGKAAAAFGWDKVMFGVQTGGGSVSPRLQAGLAMVATLRQEHPPMRGVFFWTGETSSQCKPAWCAEYLLAAAMRGERIGGKIDCKC